MELTELMVIAGEIAQDAFDPWVFDKVEKQYKGAFYTDECVCILRKHLAAHPAEPDPRDETIAALKKCIEVRNAALSHAKYSHGAKGSEYTCCAEVYDAIRQADAELAKGIVKKEAGE